MSMSVRLLRLCTYLPSCKVHAACKHGAMRYDTGANTGMGWSNTKFPPFLF